MVSTKFTVYCSSRKSYQFEKLTINLAEQGPNVTGSLLKGNTPLSGIWISGHTTAGKVWWFDTITDETGSFQLNLPDGDYQIDGIWLSAEEKWYPIVNSFSVKNGVLVGAEEIVIHLQEPIVSYNVLGTLLKGTEPLPGVWVSTHSVEEEVIWHDSQTNDSGEFAFTLPDGNYVIEGIWLDDEKTWYPLALSYSVVDGKIHGLETLEINLEQKPTFNVYGSLVHEGKPVADAEISIVNVDNSSSHSYDAYTDESGNFGLNLEDGSYKVRYMTSGDLSTVYIQKPFTVMNGELYVNDVHVDRLELSVTPESLFLKLTYNGTVVNVPELFLSDEEGYVSRAINDGSGTFVARLPDGDYRIDGYNDQTNRYIQVNREFTVENGTTTPSPFVVDVGTKQGNVQGAVIDSKGPLANASIPIEGPGFGHHVYTDSNGAFAVNLEDGSYHINRVYLAGKTVIVNLSFESSRKGEMYMNGSQSDQLIISLPDENFQELFEMRTVYFLI